MRLIALNKIADNMILAKNVYAREGNVLLAKDAPLKRNYTKRLLEWGVNSVYVQDNHGDTVEIDEELCQQTLNTVLQLVKDFFANLNPEHLPESLKKTIDDVMKQLLADGNVLQNLTEIQAVSDNIFRHSVNTSILSMLIGTLAGYDSKRLKELVTGAILIDVGKTGLANKLLGDLNQLSAKEHLELQQHSKLGFEKLQKLKDDYKNSAQIVLQHHEKYDGTGFPKGLKGNQIHEYARITAIAEVYTGYQLNEQNNGKLSQKQVVEKIEASSGISFDPEFIRLFSQKVAPLLNNPEVNSSKRSIESRSFDEQQQDGVKDQHHDLSGKPEQTTLDKQKHSIDHKSGVKETKTGDRERLDIRRDSSEIVTFEVTPELCQQTKSELLQVVDKTLSRIKTGLIPEKVLEATRTIINELVSEDGVVSNLVTIEALSDSTFTHCIAVGLLSVITGATLGYTPEQLKELGAGAMLVDVGKVELSTKYILNATTFGTLEYDAVIREHTQLGFEKLWELKGETNSPYIALQHHERFDGSGFPAGLKGKEINGFARIVALADAYDTLINEGIDGQKLMPHEVIEYIRDYSGSFFDPELSQVFLQNVTSFLVGTNVLLNTGEKAKVVRINKEFVARPVILVMVDSTGNQLPKPIEKDLVNDLTLFIVGTLTDDEL